MNYASSDSKKSTCQFKKDNGELCKRNVSEGEDRCWQHANTVGHKWKSLTRSQATIFVIGLLSLILTVAFGLLSLFTPTKEEIANEVVKKLPPLQRQHDYEKEIPAKTKTEDKIIAEKKGKSVHEPTKSTGTISKNEHIPGVTASTREEGEVTADLIPVFFGNDDLSFALANPSDT